MKKTFKMILYAGFLGAASMLTSCQKDLMTGQIQENDLANVELKKADGTRIFYGPAAEVGDGNARAWVKEGQDGEPLEVGLSLSAKALENLPQEHMAFVLPFHPNKGKRFYDHVLLDWSPDGHEPQGVYDLPHFDVHFYITSVEEREAIGLQADPDPAPDMQYVPDNYWQMPGVVPGMGSHWADMLAPELNPSSGVTFTHTFILGSYEGWWTFWEPMVTLEFLQSKPKVEVSVRQPQAWQRDGWYPAGYKIEWSEKPDQVSIVLTGLTWRQGS